MKQTAPYSASLSMVRWAGFAALLVSTLGFAAEPAPDFLLGDWQPHHQHDDEITVTKEFISWGACPPARYEIIKTRKMDVYPGNMQGQAPIAGDRWTVVTIKDFSLCIGHSNYIQFAIDDSFSFAVITVYFSEERLNKGYVLNQGRYSKRVGRSYVEWVRIFRESKSETDRAEALQKINERERPDRQEYNRIGLNDPSPLVREVAVGFMRGGDQKDFVPQLIKAMATDLSPKVRYSAADSLAHFYTDNGTDGTEDANLIAHDIGLVLSALNDFITQQPVAEILGARYSGPTPLPCRMSKEVRERAIKALQGAIAKGFTIEEMMKARPEGGFSYSTRNLEEALKNIQVCVNPLPRIDVEENVPLTLAKAHERALADFKKSNDPYDAIQLLEGAGIKNYLEKRPPDITKPAYINLLNDYGYFLSETSDRYKEAIPILKKVVELDPKRAVAHLNLGDAYLKDTYGPTDPSKQELPKLIFQHYQEYARLLKEKGRAEELPLRVKNVLESEKSK